MVVYGINSLGINGTRLNQPINISDDIQFSSVLHSTMTGTTNFDAFFEAASKKYNIPVSLLKAVAKVESNFHPNATSRCGAMGIMQLMPRTAKWLGVNDAYDPEQNIMGGAKYLRMLLDQYDGNLELTLAAYNAGPGTVRKYGGTVPPSARGYVNKVMKNLCSDFNLGSASAAPASSSGTKNTPSTEDTGTVFSAALDDASADSLSSMLLFKAIQEMQMLKAIDGDSEEQHKIFENSSLPSPNL